jgi:bacterial/archaeal transporter family-2 protein
MKLGYIIPYIFAILAGIFTTLESSINGHIGKLVTPKIATLYSLFMGLLVMFLATLLMGSAVQYKNILSLNSKLLVLGAIGGVFGALIIYFVAKIIPTLGVTVTLTMVVAAQILSGLYVDIFVLKHNIDVYKIIGSVSVLIGIYFITLKS